MATGPCPGCHDQIQFPAGLSEDTTLKCPLCQTEFAFATVARNLPPEVIVLDAKSPAAPSGGFAIAINDESSRPFDFEQKSAPSGERPSYVAPEGNKNRDRPAAQQNRGANKKEKNMVFEGLKIVLGGLAAFPLVQLAVWWLARQDPLTIGPSIANVVPFVVPKQFHGEPETDANEDENSDRETRDANKNSSENNRNTASARSVTQANQDAKPKKSSGGLETNNELSKTMQQATNSRPRIPTAELARQSQSRFVSADFEKRPVTNPGSRATIDELNREIQQLAVGLMNGENLEGAALQDHQYTSLADLAAAFYGATGDPDKILQLRDSADLLIGQYAPRPLSAISLRGKTALGEGKTSQGIAICGKVEEVSAVGRFVRASIAWAHEPSTRVDVYTNDADTTHFTPGTSVIILGVIADGKSLALVDEAVVIESLTVVLEQP
jgi:hypothetical protein